MPLDVPRGIMQSTENWIIRLLIYMTIGFTTGYIFQKNVDMYKTLREKDLINDFTGLYNTSKLFPEINNLNQNNEDFCLVFFKIMNLEDISMYVDFGIIKDIIHKSIEDIQEKYEGNDLYSDNYNEYILVLKDSNKIDINKIIKNNLEDVLNAIEINNYSFQLIIKAGVAFSDEDGSEGADLLNKARIAADQGENYESGVYNYDSNLDNERKLYYEISSCILNGIKNKEFYLVYQPIISLETNKISGVEVLARWNRGERQSIGPATFIKIAEETGLIQKITKEVISQLVEQILQWESFGIDIKVSVNITAGELLDDSFREWVRNILNVNNIDRSKLEIEITERVFAKQGEKLNKVLKQLQEKGWFVSIDDYGTGYNTFKNLEEIIANIIKVDKHYIDRIDQKYINNLVKHIIDSVQEMGMTVVAEGVETKEQLLILKELKCNKIQGYYFSKPLIAEDLAEYYKTFDINDYM